MIVDLNPDVIRLLTQARLLIRAYNPRTGKWKPVYRIDICGIDKSQLAAVLQQANGLSEFLPISAEDVASTRQRSDFAAELR